MTKSEAAKVVPSTSVAVKKSVPSSPVSSRIPATPSRRDVLFNQFNALSITQLLGELRARSLHTVGTKSELVERLVAHELKVSVCVEREGKGEKPALSSLQSESEEQMRLIQKKEEEHKLKLAGNLGTPVSRLPPSAAKPLAPRLALPRRFLFPSRLFLSFLSPSPLLLLPSPLLLLPSRSSRLPAPCPARPSRRVLRGLPRATCRA